MNGTIVVVCNIQGQMIDLQIPQDIQISTLMDVLWDQLHLSQKKDFIRCENPIAMMMGDLTVADYRLHNGSILYL